MIHNKSERRVENIVCNEQAFSAFPNLLIGNSIDNSVKYFDATVYLQSIGLSSYSPDHFFKSYFHPIHALVTAYGLDKDRVYIKNHEGHSLIDSSLVYLFISYTNPDFLAHINDRIDELFVSGFCVSDHYLYTTAKARLTPDVFLEGDNGSGTN